MRWGLLSSTSNRWETRKINEWVKRMVDHLWRIASRDCLRFRWHQQTYLWWAMTNIMGVQLCLTTSTCTITRPMSAIASLSQMMWAPRSISLTETISLIRWISSKTTFSWRTSSLNHWIIVAEVEHLKTQDNVLEGPWCQGRHTLAWHSSQISGLKTWVKPEMTTSSSRKATKQVDKAQSRWSCLQEEIRQSLRPPG